MKPITTFTTKSGREVQIIEPTTEWLDEITRWTNIIAKEDTFLTFDPGKVIIKEDEEKWLKHQIVCKEKGTGLLFWAIYNNQIIGSVDIHRGSSIRDYHIGTVGLIVDQNFRNDGLGKFLLNLILEKATELGIRTAILQVFSDNETGLALYQKAGFIEYGKLPDGLWRKNHFSDDIFMYKHLLK